MEREERIDFDAPERSELVPELDITKVADGLGFGAGSISNTERRDVTPEVRREVEQLISSPDVLVRVDKDKSGNMLDDDGCGDGRWVRRIFEGVVQRFKSLNRTKVFGGGATMATASLIGLGKATGNTLRQTFSAGMSLLKEKQIGYGGHTDTQAHGDNCGCGAIDKAPVIVANAVRFEENIRDSLALLEVDSTGLEDVFDAYSDYTEEIKDQLYKGKDVIDEIKADNRIVKELTDDHKEMYIVLNMVEGFTVDQKKVRAVSGGKVQVFAVDVWRVKQLADRMYDGEPEDIRHKAFLSELVYTLATAATLTKGDLPVYAVKKQPDLVAA